jgi:hypothetical protein
LSVLSVSFAMRVSSRLANDSPDVDRRSVIESTRVSIESKSAMPLSFIRSISVSPELVIVVDSLVEALRIESRMVSLADPISSRSVS